MSSIRRMMMAGCLVAAFAATIARTASAHHGFAAFDTSSQRQITGTVKEFQWTNPHTWVWVDVTNDKGGVDTWGFEGMSPNFLGRRGWSRKTLQPGDKITVTYFGMKNGSKGGEFLSCKLPNGQEMRMFGASPTEDN